MIYFRSDYSQGAHPKVLEALAKTNYEHSDGYGLDVHSENAEKIVKDLINFQDCSVYMMVGGTGCNVTTITAALRPFEAVVSPDSGHIYVHETGAIECNGHRIIAVPNKNGKLTPEMIDSAWDQYEDEHTVIPKMVYITQPTESGSMYSKSEMEAISRKCKEKDMYLYIDGARIGSALTSEACDFEIEDIPKLCDAFYIGLTKNGALFGEALIIINKDINDHFRWMIKRQCGLLAKGRLIGVQMEAMLEGGKDSLYFDLARKTNANAKAIRDGLRNLGVEFYSESVTNQVFPILPTPVVEKLEEDFFFYRWAPEKDGKIPVRFVASWGTTGEEVEALLNRIKELL